MVSLIAGKQVYRECQVNGKSYSGLVGIQKVPS